MSKLQAPQQAQNISVTAISTTACCVSTDSNTSDFISFSSSFQIRVMRVATIDGLVTLFYDGTRELFNRELNNERLIAHGRRLVNQGLGSAADDLEAMVVSEECKRYFRERLSWQQIIVVEGVTEIPSSTFYKCINIKRVIFADTVIRIGRCAFSNCGNLVYIKLSTNLEYIGDEAFENCNLYSVFIPPGCREIGRWAFRDNYNLTILNVPEDTEVGHHIIIYTELNQFCRIQFNDEPLNTWLENINRNDQFDLHRVCLSFEPTLDMILNTMIEKGGPNAFKVENSIGITPSRYLKENPYANVKEIDVIDKYILQMVGEL